MRHIKHRGRRVGRRAAMRAACAIQVQVREPNRNGMREMHVRVVVRSSDDQPLELPQFSMVFHASGAFPRSTCFIWQQISGKAWLCDPQ